MNKFFSLLKPLDIVCIAGAFGICATSIINTSQAPGTPVLHISTSETEYLYQLDQDAEIPVNGLTGTSVIRIQNGRAFFQESPCANKTCIQADPVYRNGDWVACLPNGIIIRVESEQTTSDIDITAY